MADTEDIGQGTWESLAPWQQAMEWYEASPDLAKDVMKEARAQMEHKRKMDFLYFWLQAGSLVASVLIALILAAVSWHAADANLAGPTVAAAGAGGLFGAGGIAITRRRPSAHGQSAPSKGTRKKK